MNDERNQILEMLAQGKITVSDAERLIDAVGGSRTTDTITEQPKKPQPKYLRVMVEEAGGDNVNIRVPLQLLRAGIQFASLIPESARGKVGMELKEKGLNFDLSNMKPEMVEEMISAMSELEVNVDESGGDRVRIFCE